MVVNLRGIQGNVAYRWYQLARGTTAGHSVEYQQFVDRFRAAAGVPASTLGVDNEFYVDTDTDTLYFKISGTWTSVGGGGGGGGTNLAIYDDTTEISAAATRLTFTGGVTVTDDGDDNQVEIAIEENVDPTVTVEQTEASRVQLTVNPGDSTSDIFAASRTVAGVMSAADKVRLDDLETYDLTISSGATDHAIPTSLEFETTAQSLTISTSEGPLATFTPVDPSTGDFAEETRFFSELPDAGMMDAELTGFTGGVDAASIVQKNGVTLQTPTDYSFTSTSVTIVGRSFNDEEVTVLNGGTLTTFAGDRDFTNNVTVEGNLTVDGNTILGDAVDDTVTSSGPLTASSTGEFSDRITASGGLTIDNVATASGVHALQVNGAADFNETVTVEGTIGVIGHATLSSADYSGDVTFNGPMIARNTSELEGEVSGDGFDRAVTALIGQHGGGSASLHVHGTAATTDPVTFVTPPGGDHLLSYLFVVDGTDYNDAIDYYTYDDTMTWRFLGAGAPTTANFVRGNYYATSGYFPTSGGTLDTEVDSDAIQDGEWLLRCTDVTQEPNNGRLIVSFRVITDGIDVATDTTDWVNRPTGSSQYVINSTNFILTCSSTIKVS